MTDNLDLWIAQHVKELVAEAPPAPRFETLTDFTVSRTPRVPRPRRTAIIVGASVVLVALIIAILATVHSSDRVEPGGHSLGEVPAKTTTTASLGPAADRIANCIQVREGDAGQGPGGSDGETPATNPGTTSVYDHATGVAVEIPITQLCEEEDAALTAAGYPRGTNAPQGTGFEIWNGHVKLNLPQPRTKSGRKGATTSTISLGSQTASVQSGCDDFAKAVNTSISRGVKLKMAQHLDEASKTRDALRKSLMKPDVSSMVTLISQLQGDAATPRAVLNWCHESFPNDKLIAKAAKK
jgi:hypothetical protein